MKINLDHPGYVYHMTHLGNLKSILEHGLLSTNEKTRLGIGHIDIANQSIQDRRANMEVTCGPQGTVHSYVPFYFCPREPMLLGLLNSKNVDQQFIIYLAVKIDVAERDDVVFSSASANTGTPPSFYCDHDELTNLRWDLIDSGKWTFSSDDDRHAMMAEVLVHNKVDISEIGFIVVWNEHFKKTLGELCTKANCQIESKFDGYQLNFGGQLNYRNHYFTKFWINGAQSLITGPKLLYDQYKETVKIIKKNHKSSIPNPKFKNVSEAIDGIAEDFTVISELAAIEKLETSNPQHWQSVGDHTKRVVEKLEELEEYSGFGDSQKKVLKLAAYLHDIGKGVSYKDNTGKQKTDNDHPASAIPMLERILSEDIESISNKKIRQIAMLVIYHDLIGDVIGKGRNREQILGVIRTIEDFDMLVAISKADVSSLIREGRRNLISLNDSAPWLANVNDQVPSLRNWVDSELEQDDD